MERIQFFGILSKTMNYFIYASAYLILSKSFLAKMAFPDSCANSMTFWKFIFASSVLPLLRLAKASC